MKKIIVLCIMLSGCAHVSARVFPYLDGECPWDFPVKGNDGNRGFIYHDYESPYYERVDAEWCFTNTDEARAYGYRKYKVHRSY